MGPRCAAERKRHTQLESPRGAVGTLASPHAPSAQREAFYGLEAHGKNQPNDNPPKPPHKGSLTSLPAYRFRGEERPEQRDLRRSSTGGVPI